MIWHFLEVWALLLAAFAIGGALGTLVYMGLAVSPLADAQIATADAIADRIDALRDAVGRRRDTGLYRGHHEAPRPAFVASFPPSANEPDAYADSDPVPEEEEPYDDEPEERVAALESAPPAAPAGEAEEYWEDDEWAPDEDDVRWAEDYEWPAEEETAVAAAAAMSAAEPHPEDLPADGLAVADEDGEAAVSLEDTGDDEPSEEGDSATGMVAVEELADAEEPFASDDRADDVDVAPVEAVAEPAGALSEPVAMKPEAEPESASAPAPLLDDGAVAAAPDAGAEQASREEDGEPSEGEAELVPLVPAASMPEPEAPGAAEEVRGSPLDGEPIAIEPVDRAVAAPVVPIAPSDAPVEAASEPALAPLAAAAPTEPAEPPVRTPTRRVSPKHVASAEPATRPLALPGPRNGVPDNLQRIRGIGQKNEELLNALGIYHFGQMAAWTPAEARWIANQLAFPERLERDDWVGQAIVFATGGDTVYVKPPARPGKDDESPVAA